MIRPACAALLWLAACGDNAAAPIDASPPADSPPAGACIAMFAGNFGETSTPVDCATVKPGAGPFAGHVELDFTIPVAAIDTPLGVMLDLGAAPTPGEYSSETSPGWNTIAVEHVGSGACFYSAGSTAVPTGSFTLTLDSIDATTAHGSFQLLQYVLRFVDEQGHESECGPGDIETLSLMF